jgi:hypothetical protein
MPVAPPVPVPSVIAMPHSCSLRAMVVPLVLSVLPVPARSRAPSRSARAPPLCEDPFALPLRLGASPSPGTESHDASPLYLAMAPLPAAATGPASGPAEVQHHPWDGHTKVGPGAGPSARLVPSPCHVLSSVGALSARLASSHAAPPVAVAAAATTATAAADEEDDPVHSSCRSLHVFRASAAPSASRTFTEVVIINDDNNDNEGPHEQSARGPHCMPLQGAMHTAVLAAALAPREGSGCYSVRYTHVETFCVLALELTAAK